LDKTLPQPAKLAEFISYFPLTALIIDNNTPTPINEYPTKRSSPNTMPRTTNVIPRGKRALSWIVCFFFLVRKAIAVAIEIIPAAMAIINHNSSINMLSITMQKKDI
jgi:hypothetical protein